MRNNENTEINGTHVILVPYKAEHVLKYHEWMKDPFLQLMTASEPLSLEAEYEMQQSWHDDPQKCTFILLSKERQMIGDVNLFLNDPDDYHAAEIEVMIAEAAFRGKGIASEALKLLIEYAAIELKLCRFIAKISNINTPSLNLFHKLGFKETGQSHIFNETTLELYI